MMIHEMLCLWALLLSGILGAFLHDPARAAIQVTVSRARNSRHR
jgi:hypothetical protein